MNGVSLKDLRWFTTFNDEFCVSETVSIWQAVLYILPYFDDDASVNYFEDIQRMEISVCEDLIEELDEGGGTARRDDTSPNYEHSYSEWDDMGNRLLTEEQINAFLPELNRSRMLVIEQIQEADNIYQQLKLEIRKSRGNQPTKIELVEDASRDDFERVLIKRTSLDAVFDKITNEKSTTWRDIIIVIDYKNSHKPIIQFKSGQEVLNEGAFEKFGFKGVNRSEKNRTFQILESMHESNRAKYLKLKHGISFRKEMTDLRNLLRKYTGLSGNPFEPKQIDKDYEPKFRVIIK